METKFGPKLQQLENFLRNPNSDESTSYINDLLSRETERPEELFVQRFLNYDFWRELGYNVEEIKFERHAGITGRVEWTLSIDGKLIAVECKRPYFVKNNKEIKNELNGNDISELEGQISKYLLSHEFIIFTNGFHWFFYSRVSYSSWLNQKNKKSNQLMPFFKYFTSEEIFDQDSPNYITNFLHRDNILEAISSLENKSIRHVITDDFFNDLRSWVGLIDSALSDAPADIKARTTSLINKLIFVRTMEGSGIIPNDFLMSIWNSKKGVSKSVVSFVDQIDEELSEIYDTELFTAKYVENKDGKVETKNGMPSFNPMRAKNYAYIQIPENFISALLKPTSELNIKDRGVTKIRLKERDHYIRSLYWWKFESISADILGKAYETYLAKERKKLGIYYTPHDITEYLTENTISTIFDEKISKLKEETQKELWEKKKIELLAKEIKEIRICDPSCGSGSFLIQAIRIIWRKYHNITKLIQNLYAKETKGSSSLDSYSSDKFGLIKYLDIQFHISDPQLQIGSLILCHIYGNDKDEKAISTAKLNIWLECLRLSPNIFRRDKISGKRHVLPNLELNITKGDSLIGLSPEETSSLISSMTGSLKFIHQQKQEYIAAFDRTAIANSAAEMKNALSGHADHEFINKLGLEKTEYILEMLTPTHWAIQHSEAFFDDNEQLKPEDERGFDVIIGNPPWEILKPSEDEFFGPLHDTDTEIKFSLLTKTEKNKFIKKTLENEFYRAQWEFYKKKIETQLDYFQTVSYYKHQSGMVDGKRTSGDVNLYKLFLERYFQILKKNGRAGIVLPSGVYTDLGSKGLRELIFNNTEIYSLYGFENRKGIFEEIHRQFKFITLVFQKGRKSENFKSSFYIQNDRDIHNLDKNCLEYKVEFVHSTSPKSLSIMECKTQQEVDIMKKLFKNPKLCDKTKWDLDFTNEFHMTKHSPLFNEDRNGISLFEGKMIHQFTHQFAQPRYWIEEKIGKELLKTSETKKIKTFFKSNKLKSEKISIEIDCENFRLVWRDITNATNERTLISTILPPNVFLGNTLNYVKPIKFNGKSYHKTLSYEEMLFICGLFNSFVIDFILRHKVSTHANMFYVAELPIQKFVKTNLDHLEIVNIVAKLVCTSDDFKELQNQIGLTKFEKNNRINNIIRINTLAAKIYEITFDDLEFILTNFPLIEDEIKKQILVEFKKISI